MSTWIFSFRQQEVRDVTNEELEFFREALKRSRALTLLYAFVAVAAGLLIFLAISIAAGGVPWGWAFMVAMIVLFFVALERSTHQSRNLLLMKRLLRLGRVSRFVRGTPPPDVRTQYEVPRMVDGEPEHSIYWEDEERFEQELIELLGHSPASIDVLPDDFVVFAAEGKPLKTVRKCQAIVIADRVEAHSTESAE